MDKHKSISIKEALQIARPFLLKDKKVESGSNSDGWHISRLAKIVLSLMYKLSFF
ncbi:hypothetical protein FHT21_000398 [Pedobacter sp. SG908]|nr:hypothetical protein [Pedobacter sp. SG908]NMN35359.1 hypothetical protein [Pedobacter sp. SG918]